MSEQSKSVTAELTSEIVAAYVANNSIPVAELPGLIRTINQTLLGLNQPPASAVAAEPPTPAVPIKKSVTDDYLISLFDGRQFKSLKRHLSAEHNMTPDEYRTMFGLPKNYPMVAPGYAKQRSALAKSLGLGRRPAVAEAAPEKRNRTKPAA